MTMNTKHAYINIWVPRPRTCCWGTATGISNHIHEQVFAAAAAKNASPSGHWRKAQTVRPGSDVYAAMRAQLNADLAYIETAYNEAQQEKEDEKIANAYYEQAVEDAPPPLLEAKAAPDSLVDLRSSQITDEQLAATRAVVYTSTRHLKEGMTKMVTAKRLEQPEIATWMTLTDPKQKAAAKAELMAYKQAVADREEAQRRREHLVTARPR